MGNNILTTPIKETPRRIKTLRTQLTNNYVEVSGASGKTYFMDKYLKAQLDKKAAHMKQNDDLLVIIVGDEGAGKSEFRDQIGDYLAWKFKTDFTVESNIHFRYKEYMKEALNAAKFTVHSHDEARRDLNKLRMMSHSNVTFNNYLSECRDNNQVHIILLPSFADLDPYVATHRATFVLKVYKVEDPDEPEKLIRGVFSAWSCKRDKEKTKEANKSTSNKFPPEMFAFFGAFPNQRIFSEVEYSKKKDQFKKKKYEESEQGVEQNEFFRNVCLSLLNGRDPEYNKLLDKKYATKINKEGNIEYTVKNKFASTRELSKILERYDLKITQSGISYAIRNLKSEESK